MEEQQAEHIGRLVKMLNDTLECRANQNLKEWDLTLQQTRILGFLKSQGGCAAQKDAAKEMKVSGPTLVGLLQRLEAKGFVEIRIDPQDRRKRIISLTEKEMHVRALMHNHHEKMEAILCRGLTAEQRAELIVLLKKVYDNLQNEELVDENYINKK